jgi:hypothetical protein
MNWVGDINISENIELQGKKIHCFLKWGCNG